MKLTFLGAARTVTGSKYFIETQNKKILIDCGLFQGTKALRKKNWSNPPFNPEDIDAVLLTHAHIDHSGYIPLLVKRGFRGPVFCTEATMRLCEILLPDSGFLQEEEAAHANLHGYSRHKPARPLYTREEAARSLVNFMPIAYDSPYDKLLPDGAVTWHRAGHILGASFIEVHDKALTVTFSGDVGRDGDPLMKPKSPLNPTDHLILESTYGDSLHEPIHPMGALKNVIHETINRGGSLLIPAFSVGRVQLLLYYLHTLKIHNHIPDVPIYLDSPMAIEATELLLRFENEHLMSHTDCLNISSIAKYVLSAKQSILLAESKSQKIIISASGMLTGGRVLHYFKALAPFTENTILLTGYQAPDTRGEKLLNHSKMIRVHGHLIPVRAKVMMLPNLSAHADYQELIDWISPLTPTPPKGVYLTHGAPRASRALKKTIESTLNWPCIIPKYYESVVLT